MAMMAMIRDGGGRDGRNGHDGAGGSGADDTCA